MFLRLKVDKETFGEGEKPRRPMRKIPTKSVRKCWCVGVCMHAFACVYKYVRLLNTAVRQDI